MSDRPTVDYQSAEDLLLFRLQFALAKNERLDNSLDALSRLLELPLPLERICADRLEGNGLCKIRKGEEVTEHPVTGNLTTYEEEYLEITELGVNEVQSWTPEKYREVAQRSDLTPGEWEFSDVSDALTDPSGASFTLDVSPLGGEHTQALDTDDDNQVMPVAAVPASDRTVSLDHNSPAYGEVVENLEELKRAIESNNEYRETDVEDHERRLTDVESTLKLLENKRVNVNAMKAVAFGSLVYLAEKFAEHPIGELAKAAWDGLKALLGIG